MFFLVLNPFFNHEHVKQRSRIENEGKGETKRRIWRIIHERQKESEREIESVCVRERERVREIECERESAFML